MTKLNLGCGLWLKSGFINVDKYYTEEQLRSKKGAFKNTKVEPNAKFVQADIGKLPFDDNYAELVEMNQVIEHFPIKQIVTYMREVYRVMKKGGKLYISCPSFNGVISDWLYMVSNPPFNPDEYLDLAEIIYGNQLADGEMHRCPITPEFINFVLTAVGFKKGSVFIARKGTKVNQVKWLIPLKKDSVFRNDQIIVEAEK
jgi:SAM-dependent methyltransferase